MRAWLAGEEKTGACGNVDAGELVDHCSHRVRDSSAYVASAYSVDVVEPVDDEEDLPLGVFGAAVEQSFGECFGGSCESWADACDGVGRLKLELVEEAADDDVH